jgi:hypothetical protein
MSLGIFPTGDSPSVVRWISLLVGIVAFLMCAGFLFLAVDSQISGKAIYRYGPRDMLSEKVESKSEPQKYHEALQKLYFRAGAAGLIGYVSLVFFRKLGD